MAKKDEIIGRRFAGCSEQRRPVEVFRVLGERLQGANADLAGSV
jgi:hypothetical protein